MVVLGIPPTRPETGFGYIQCRGNDLSILFRLRNVMIRGQNREQRIASRNMPRVNRGQPNRHRCIQPLRLDQHAFARSRRHLLSNGRRLLRVRHRPNALARNQREQPRGCLLQHGFFAHNVKQLLRRARPAPWPEPRSAPPGQNDSMRCKFFFVFGHGLRRTNLAQRLCAKGKAKHCRCTFMESQGTKVVNTEILPSVRME